MTDLKTATAINTHALQTLNEIQSLLGVSKADIADNLEFMPAPLNTKDAVIAALRAALADATSSHNDLNEIALTKNLPALAFDATRWETYIARVAAA